MALKTKSATRTWVRGKMRKIDPFTTVLVHLDIMVHGRKKTYIYGKMNGSFATQPKPNRSGALGVSLLLARVIMYRRGEG